MAGYVIIRRMKRLVPARLRPALLTLFCTGPLLLSACQATSESAVQRWSEPAFAGIPDAGKLGELSGMARSNRHDGIFWAMNDGDNAAELVAIDAQAKTRATIQVEGVRNIDWEDVASYEIDGRSYLAIADTGDNGGIRPELFIHIFEEPEQLADVTLKPIRSLRFRWADGARDVESMMASGQRGRFYLISKKRVPAELFTLAMDAADGSSPELLSVLDGIAQPDAKTMNTKGDFGRYRAQITGADLEPDGQVFAVLNYQQINFFALPERPVPALKPLATITLPWLPQAEAIGYSADGDSLFVGSEQAPTPMIRFDRIQP